MHKRCTLESGRPGTYSGSTSKDVLLSSLRPRSQISRYFDVRGGFVVRTVARKDLSIGSPTSGRAGGAGSLCNPSSGGLSLLQKAHLARLIGKKSPSPLSCSRSTILSRYRNLNRNSCRKVGTHFVAASLAAGPTSFAVASGWSLWALLTACAAGGQVLEQRTVCGRFTSAPLLTMVLGIALASAGVIPTACFEYDIIWSHLLPLGAALYLLESRFSKMLTAGTATLVAFGIGAMGTVLGTVAAWVVVGSQLGPEGWKVAGALCASYIGGSINFAAVAAMVHLGAGPLVAATMAADNIAMAVYLAAISLIPTDQDSTPKSSKAQSEIATSALPVGVAQLANATSAVPDAKGRSALVQPRAVTAESTALALAAAAAAAAVARIVTKALGCEALLLAVVALMASGIGMLAGAFVGEEAAEGLFLGASPLGAVLMLLFFASVGAGVGALPALVSNLYTLAFIAIQLAVHMAVVIGVGRMAKIPMEAILTASNANIGGPATAAAMATARGWPHMISPAMLTGSLGYAIGSAIGGAVGFSLKAHLPLGVF